MSINAWKYEAPKALKTKGQDDTFMHSMAETVHESVGPPQRFNA